MTKRVMAQEARGSRASAALKGRRSSRRIFAGGHTFAHWPQTRQSLLLLSRAGFRSEGQLRAAHRSRRSPQVHSLPAQAPHVGEAPGRIAIMPPRP